MLLLSGCASITGYPSDPGNKKANLDSFSEGFSSAIIVNYNNASGADKTALRNKIIFERLSSYDIVFNTFERKLSSQRNTITSGTDLLVLALTGLSTTAASAGSKTAFSAAATGVVGAGGAINKDLFYQAALPAILTQMEAGRALVLADLIKGMAEDDTKYPLALALHDLERYANAGSIPAALSTVTKTAVDKKNAADADVSNLRTLKFEADSPNTKSLVGWLYPGGDETKPPIATNLANLQTWMANDTTDPKLGNMPWYHFLHGTDPGLEQDRARAAAKFNSSSGATQ